MERSEIEAGPSQAVKNLRSKFEQLAVGKGLASTAGKGVGSTASSTITSGSSGRSSRRSSNNGAALDVEQSDSSPSSNVEQIVVRKASAGTSGSDRSLGGISTTFAAISKAIQSDSTSPASLVASKGNASTASNSPSTVHSSRGSGNTAFSAIEQRLLASNGPSNSSSVNIQSPGSRSPSRLNGLGSIASSAASSRSNSTNTTFSPVLNVEQSGSTSSSETSGSKAAALKRPPPPPPPPRSKRSLSPMPSIIGPPTSPVLRPPPMLSSGTGSVGVIDIQKGDRPPVPPRPAIPLTQSPEPSSDEDTASALGLTGVKKPARPPVPPKPSREPSSDDDRPRYLIPPRRQALSPNPSNEGLPMTAPPLPLRRSPDMALKSPRPNLVRPPPSPRSDALSARLPPPPTRTIARGVVLPPVRPPAAESSDDEDDEDISELQQLPDSSHASRRPPLLSFRAGAPEPRIPYHAHTGSVLASGPNVIVAHGSHLKVYNLANAEPLVHNVEMKEFGLKDSRIVCMEFRACLNPADRGFVAWLGTKEGSIIEFDIRKGAVTTMKPAAHIYPITHMFRHGRSMMSLDDSGKALIFSPDPDHPEIDVSLKDTVARVVRTTDKQEFVKLLDGKLWTSGKTEYQGGNRTLPVVRVYDIFSPGAPGKSLLPSDHVGKITSATILPCKPDRVYMGHEEGYVSVWILGTEDGWPKCEEVIKVSISDVMSLAGVNDKLWAGGRGGVVTVYDVSSMPWTVTNNWIAHDPGLPVLKLTVNYYAIAMSKSLCVVSLGRDEQVRFWDGLLGLDWIDTELIKNEPSFSTFQDITTLLLTYNVSAIKPESLNCDQKNAAFFEEVFKSVDAPPDLLSFSLQEVVDLEKKGVMTRSVFTTVTSKKPDALSDKVTGNYRRWYDRLLGAVKTAFTPVGVTYDVVSVESMVGLFSLVLVKRSDQLAIRDVALANVKRGLGGRYGNKGAIISRLVVGDSSICIVNCHLAAGQHGVRRRNADITAFVEEKDLFNPSANELMYVGGGDGRMVLDHEFVLWNGDMNFRIDLRREMVISAIRSGDFGLLRNHDQLLREMKGNRGFRLRGFSEGPLNFAPTYKYDPRSNEYDTSEKKRVPSWCDRVLWRSRVPSRVKQLHYRRYDNVDVSDHRPVSAAFAVTIKSIDLGARSGAERIVKLLWQEQVEKLLLALHGFYVEQGLL